MKYQITKKFIGGVLEGLTITEQTSVLWKVGTRVEKPVAGSPYIIIEVKEIK